MTAKLASRGRHNIKTVDKAGNTTAHNQWAAYPGNKPGSESFE